MTARDGVDRRLAGALGRGAASGGAGIVTATRGKLRRLFCLDGGRLVAAASNVIEEQLDHCLVRSGLLAPERRAELAAEAEKRGTKIPFLARESGAVRVEELIRAQEALIEQLLFATLEWPDGDVEFVPGRPNLADAITVDLSPIALVLRFCRIKAPGEDALRVRIGGPGLRFRRADVADGLVEAIELDASARHILETTRSDATLADLLQGAPDGEEAVLRAVYGLLLTGALSQAAAETPRPEAAARRGPEGPLTRDECLGRLAMAERADHYEILGVDRDASPDEIRERYYALARRFHPDRFRSGELQDLLARFETFFSRVTDAHNTLANPDLRREYTRSLEEATPSREATRESDPTFVARQNFLRAQELVERRRYNDAATFLENAVRLDGKQAEYRLELGRLLARNPRRRHEAAEHLVACIGIDPSSTDAYLALGHLLLRAGRPAEAARLFRSALSWDAENAEARRQLSALGEPLEASAADPAFLSGLFSG